MTNETATTPHKWSWEATPLAWQLVPEHRREELRLYIEHGCPVGSNMNFILSGNLFEAFGNADETTRVAMYDICRFLYNHAPNCCFGSPSNVQAWHEHNGLEGLN